MVAASKLSKCIAFPQKIANILDWKKGSERCVMSLDISEQRVGIAYSVHPSPTNVVFPLEPIPYMSVTKPMKRIDQNERLHAAMGKLVQKHHVCAFVVAWPLQPGGRMGVPCGKVLHVLDVLVDTKPSIISRVRPFTLWDGRDLPRNDLEVALKNDRECVTDDWGRSEIFTRAPSASLSHYSSKEQYYHEFTKDSTGASLILKNFMDNHFEPKVITEEHEVLDDLHAFSHAIDCSGSMVDNDEYASRGTYIQPGLL